MRIAEGDEATIVLAGGKASTTCSMTEAASSTDKRVNGLGPP